MLRIGKDELICDIAETYHVYDMNELRPSVLATLAVGLRPDSRIMMKLSGAKADPQTQMLAAILDGINILIWQRTKDGAKNTNRPKSVLLEMTRDHSTDTVGFESSDDLMRELRKYE